MTQSQSQALPIAAAFARVGGLAAAQANANRRAISEANIAAETFQSDLALQQTRSKLAEAFAKHAGILAVNAAHRGSSLKDASPQAALLSAAFRASNEVAVAEANRAAQVSAVRARNTFVEEDVKLAQIEGALRGLDIGFNIASALDAAAEQRQQHRVKVLDVGPGQFGFANVVEDLLFTPGLDFTNFNFSNFGIDLGF